MHPKPGAIRVLAIAGICGFLLVYDAAYSNWRQHPCYAQAMIGSDSVINARLGVPVEDVLKLAEVGGAGGEGETGYSVHMLNTVLQAYLWDKSPYHYSVQVFYQCTNDAQMAGLFVTGPEQDG
ncbi:MAG TPA: hypothetical protein ENK29_05665 [Chromatiales bacterium]|nr:hypothetical protein [Chromatiales bacterium]